jgi:DnaJ-class molecular chaperone
MAATITCPKCGGKGTVNKRDIGRVVCSVCDGTGMVEALPPPKGSI